MCAGSRATKIIACMFIVFGGGVVDLVGGANVFSNPVALHALFGHDAQIAAAIRTVLEDNEIEISRVEAAAR